MSFPTISEKEAVAAAAGILGTGILTAAILGGRKKRSSRGRKRDRKFISKQSWERRYVKKHGSRGRKKYHSRKKSKSRHGRKVFYARKTGQPYIRLANGQARFIKGKRRK